jgi:hypothetical protein
MTATASNPGILCSNIYVYDYAYYNNNTTWSTQSDIRLKTNVIEADTARCYEKLRELRLMRWKWIDEKKHDDLHKLGWIAQEVEKVFPKSVSVSRTPDIPDCKTINIDQIIATMWGCLEHIQEKLDVLMR